MKQNKVLIVVDAQEDFTRGALHNEDAIAALPTIKEVVDYACENFEKSVFYTADTHQDNYLKTQEGINLPVPHCIEGTPGWEICPEVRPNFYHMVINKPTFGFMGWKNEAMVGDAKEIWLCGFCTDICVSANFQILKATYPEIPIYIISDACAGVTPEMHEAALKVMSSCQGHVVTWEQLKSMTE